MTDKTVEELLEDCRSDDTKRQYHGARLLIEKGDESAVPTLLPLLSSPDEMVRYMAIDALAQLSWQTPEAVGPAIQCMLDDPSEMARNQAAESLRFLEYRPAVPRLQETVLHDPDWVTRCSAAEALGDIGDPAAIPTLFVALEDEYDAVRCYAANSLSLLGTADILPRLAQAAAEEPGLDVRTNIHIARYRIGDREALGPLLDLVNDPDEEVAGDFLDVIYKIMREQRLPPTLDQDRAAIRQALVALEQRRPEWKGLCDKSIAYIDGKEVPG